MRSIFTPLRLVLSVKASRIYLLSCSIKNFRTYSTMTIPVAKDSSIDVKCHIKRQVDKIIASPEDKMMYRGLELNNDLKVLLISDPTTDKSAASIDVNTGHLHDPIELPGLAHFCEHMLFLGTEKYPVENDYQKFISNHGGCCNAYTSTDHTNYHFDVAPEHLDGAFDRFAQFFISPLFTESGTDREVLAVDSEHANYVKDDWRRLWQLERALSDPQHDYAKFGTGNRETLGDGAKSRGLDTRQELLRFHQCRYSSNRMTLAVLGKQTIDELTHLVVPTLAQIPNKNLPIPEWSVHPYGPDQVCKRRDVVPIKDLRLMRISFPIPDQTPYYRSNPGHYVSHLIGHEGPGSLLSELKRRGWVNALSAGPNTAARGFGFFSADFELSPDGLEHTDDILLMLFQYIGLLIDAGPQKWIHREVESLNEIHFRFQDKMRPQTYATHLSEVMHQYPLEEVLYAPYMMPDYRPELITELLAQLSPSNFTYSVISQDFKGKVDQVEKWYGTEHSVRHIDKELLEKCRTAGTNSFFKLPDQNEFIPNNFALQSSKVPEKSASPELIYTEPLYRIWFRQDDEYLLPKCCVYMLIRNPVVFVDPKNFALAALLSDLVKDSLTEYAYNAELAGLKYSFSNVRYGFSLNLFGYDEKQHVFVTKFMDKLTAFKPDAERFKILKERMERSLRNFKMEQPYQHAVYYTKLLMTDRAWTNEEILRELEDTSLGQIEDFASKFLDSLHLEAYIHGNAHKKGAESMIQSLIDILKKSSVSRPLYASQLTRDRGVLLPDGCNFCFEATNETHSNSALEVILQTGVEDSRENMLNELLSKILSEPCYDQLRTKEQLGYIVFSGLIRVAGTQGLRFIIQGEKSPEIMNERLEAFLDSMLDRISNMPESEFEENKSSLATLRLEKPKKMSGLAQKHWAEITSEYFHFDRDVAEVEVLKTLSKDDIMSFYKDKVMRSAPKRRKLSVHVRSSKIIENGAAAFSKESGAEQPESVEIIQNIVDFKLRMPLCQLPKPHRPVPMIGLVDIK